MYVYFHIEAQRPNKQYAKKISIDLDANGTVVKVDFKEESSSGTMTYEEAAANVSSLSTSHGTFSGPTPGEKHGVNCNKPYTPEELPKKCGGGPPPTTTAEACQIIPYGKRKAALEALGSGIEKCPQPWHD